MKRKLREKEEDIKYLLLKRNEICKCIYDLKDCIHQLSLAYKNSYKKWMYMKFTSISELCDYRLELTDKENECRIKLNVMYKDLKIVNDLLVLMYNDLLYNELLLNK
jgi:hypothetical protein